MAASCSSLWLIWLPNQGAAQREVSGRGAEQGDGTPRVLRDGVVLDASAGVVWPNVRFAAVRAQRVPRRGTRTYMLFVVIVVLQNSSKMLMLSALVDVIHDYVQSEAQIDTKATYLYQHLPWFSICGVE